MSDTRCECGCGRPLPEGARRWARESCRKRAARRADREVAATATTATVDHLETDGVALPSSNGDDDVQAGQARDGLEAWLEATGAALPAGHVEQARILASAVDAAPGDSALHGRLLQALEALREHETAVLAAHQAQAQALIADLRGEATLDELRARRARRARDDEHDDAARYDRLVPAGCVRGEHRGGGSACLDCGTLM